MAKPNNVVPLRPETQVLSEQFESSLREIGIPPRPTILEQIAEESRQGEPDFHRIAELIGRDVGLAAGLLKTANSPFFGYRSKAHSVSEALMMLGLNVTARTVAGLILRKVLPVAPHLERFWDVSDRIAQLSGWLVSRLGAQDGVKAEDAYTFGLFRDCGIPIMMRRFPGYAETLETANRDALRAFTAVEEAQHPTNHAIVGCVMAQSWWLPEQTCQAIRHHHDAMVLDSAGVSGLPMASRRLMALAQLAEHLLQNLTGLGQTREWDKLGALTLAFLGLSESDVALLQEQAQLFLDTLAEL